MVTKSIRVIISQSIKAGLLFIQSTVELNKTSQKRYLLQVSKITTSINNNEVNPWENFGGIVA